MMKLPSGVTVDFDPHSLQVTVTDARGLGSIAVQSVESVLMYHMLELLNRGQVIEHVVIRPILPEGGDL